MNERGLLTATELCGRSLDMYSVMKQGAFGHFVQHGVFRALSMEHGKMNQFTKLRSNCSWSCGFADASFASDKNKIQVLNAFAQLINVEIVAFITTDESKGSGQWCNHKENNDSDIIFPLQKVAMCWIHTLFSNRASILRVRSTAQASNKLVYM